MHDGLDMSSEDMNDQHAALATRLRVGAGACRVDPPAALRGRVLASIEAAERDSVVRPSRSGGRVLSWLAAASLTMVTGAASMLLLQPVERPLLADTADIADVAPQEQRTLVTAVDPLRNEAAHLADDARAVAGEFIAQLPQPARRRMIEMLARVREAKSG